MRRTDRTDELDTVFEVLSDRRRRYALYVLYRADGGAITVDRLTRRVSRMEDDPGDERHTGRIENEIRYNHLPKLIDAGLVEYDERSDTVCYHRRPALEEWLEHAEYREGYHPKC